MPHLSAISLFAGIVLFATPALAQMRFDATASTSNTTYEEDAVRTIKAAAAFDVSPELSLSSSVAHFVVLDAFELTNLTGRVMHAISPETRVGLFFAEDSADNYAFSAMGAEFISDIEGLTLEGYYAYPETEGITSGIEETMFGFSAGLRLSERFLLTYDLDEYAFSTEASDLVFFSSAYGGQLQVTDGFVAFARRGSYSETQTNGTALLSETTTEFTEIGGQFNMGPSRRPLMSSRSSYDALGF